MDFKIITAHQGPVNKNHPGCKGLTYNIKVEWENGEITYEPLDMIAKDDSLSCAIYTRDNDLLETFGWKLDTTAAYFKKPSSILISTFSTSLT